jgi:DNA-binding response OmpR family regulator
LIPTTYLVPIRYTILVVDDDRAVTDTLVVVLNQSGFIAKGCYSAHEAVTLAAENQFDLVLLDVVMPDAKGLEHAIEIRVKSRCEVLLISGQPSTAEYLAELERRDIPSFNVVAKPIHPRDLLAEIRDVLADRHLHEA